MKAKWPSLTRMKDILLAAVATATLITVLYTYIGGRFMESSRITEFSAHAQNQGIHLDSLKNERIQNVVTKEVMDLRFAGVAYQLEALRQTLDRNAATVDRIEKQHEEIKSMFVKLLKNGGPGRRQ